MAHELDFSTGAAAMLSVRQTPWHQHGEVLTDAPTIPDALHRSRLDWQVVTEPIFLNRELDRFDSVYTAIDGKRATVRTDTNAPLGIVSDKYKPLQNADAFAIMEPLIDSGLASIETCGALRGGKDVWLLVAFNTERMADQPEDRIIAEVFNGRDPVKPYGLIANNHAGVRQVTLQETAVRVVCANTLSMAFRGSSHSVGVRHTLNVEANVIEAAQTLWGGLIRRYRHTAEAYQRLQQKYLDASAFERAVLDVIAPLTTKGSDEPMTKLITERRTATRNEVTRLWTEGTGHTGDHSAWEAYQAVTEAIDHTDLLGTTRSIDAKLEALQVGGRLHDLKANVLEAILAEV